ncbi:MAG TPA: Na+/H+ antiporter subunit E [Gammaproteobacteria bacterium]|nr:Na+/H+ antiporter subunit E [Gammaproteobacteria bacterium]
MRRLPKPPSLALAALLLAMWLLLNETLAPRQILLGAILGLALASAAAALRPLRSHVRSPLVAARLVFRVLADVALSNIRVARVVLAPRAPRRVRSGFVEIPLDLRDPHGLAALAMIVTSTPGTVWAGVSPDGRTLTLHVLDLDVEPDWTAWLKQRYEKPLMRIFE